MVSTLQKSLDDAKAKRALHEASMEKATVECKELLEKLDASQVKANLLDKAVRKSDDEAKKLVGQLADKDAKVKALQEEATKCRQAEREADERRVAAEKEAEAFKAAHDTKHKETESEKNKATDSDALASQLKDQLRSQAQLIDNLRKELEDDGRVLRDERHRAKENEVLLQNLRDDQHNLRNNLADRDDKLHKLQSKLDTLLSDEKSDDSLYGSRADLSDELQRWKLLCDEKENTIKALQNDILALKRALSTLESQFAALQHAQAAENALDEQRKKEAIICNEALKSCQDDCKDKDEKIKALQKELDNLKKLASKRDDELANLESLLDAATRKSGDVSESLRECQERDREKDAVILALQDSGNQKDEMIHTLIAASKVKESVINKLQKEIEDMRNSLKREIVPKTPVETGPSKERSQPEIPFRITRQVPDLVGVGIRLTDIPPHRVVEIVADGPADNSGQIQVGDLLLSVNRDDVSSMHISSIRKLIVGPQGSNVSMEFQRAGSNQIFTVTMQRQLHIEQY